jgi:sugar phosphate isomerase/epimerase
MAKVTTISSLGWAHYTLYEALPRIAERGFRQMEIASFATYCFHFNFGSPEPIELKDMLNTHCLAPICLNFWGGPQFAWKPEDVEGFITLSRKKIEHCRKVGIPKMVMHIGFDNPRRDRKKQLETMIKAYDRVGRIGSQNGVKMLLEVPHMFSLIHDVQTVLWILERLNSSNVGILIDSSHWGVMGYDIDDYLKAIGDRLWHVHLRDSKVFGPGKYDLELTPGKGTVDFSKFAFALDKAGYQGDVSLEFEYRDVSLSVIEKEFDAGIRHLARQGWLFPKDVNTKYTV